MACSTLEQNELLILLHTLSRDFQCDCFVLSIFISFQEMSRIMDDMNADYGTKALSISAFNIEHK